MLQLSGAQHDAAPVGEIPYFAKQVEQISIGNEHR